MRYRDKRQWRRRSGVGTLELILTLPIIVVLLIATVEYTVVVVLNSAVIHAATVGAREAGKCPSIGVVVDAVQGVLAGNCITISNAPGSGTKVILEDGPSITDSYGDPNVTDCQLPANALNAGEVRVTLCIDLAATRLCDPLQAFGFSLIDCRLHASAVVKREELP